MEVNSSPGFEGLERATGEGHRPAVRGARRRARPRVPRRAGAAAHLSAGAIGVTDPSGSADAEWTGGPSRRQDAVAAYPTADHATNHERSPHCLSWLLAAARHCVTPTGSRQPVVERRPGRAAATGLQALRSEVWYGGQHAVPPGARRRLVLLRRTSRPRLLPGPPRLVRLRRRLTTTGAVRYVFTLPRRRPPPAGRRLVLHRRSPTPARLLPALRRRLHLAWTGLTSTAAPGSLRVRRRRPGGAPDASASPAPAGRRGAAAPALPATARPSASPGLAAAAAAFRDGAARAAPARSGPSSASAGQAGRRRARSRPAAGGAATAGEARAPGPAAACPRRLGPGPGPRQPPTRTGRHSARTGQEGRAGRRSAGHRAAASSRSGRPASAPGSAGSPPAGSEGGAARQAKQAPPSRPAHAGCRSSEGQGQGREGQGQGEQEVGRARLVPLRGPLHDRSGPSAVASSLPGDAVGTRSLAHEPPGSPRCCSPPAGGFFAFTMLRRLAPLWAFRKDDRLDRPGERIRGAAPLRLRPVAAGRPRGGVARAPARRSSSPPSSSWARGPSRSSAWASRPTSTCRSSARGRPPGDAYAFVKDVAVLLALFAALAFLWRRAGHEARPGDPPLGGGRSSSASSPA